MTIEEAANGYQALQMINGLFPSSSSRIFVLPGVNGLQLTQTIKKDFPDIPWLS